MNTIEPGVLRVGCWDKYFQHDQHSLTRLRDPQPSFKWIENCDDPAVVDVALATQNSGGVLLGSPHPRKVLYLQETSEFHGNRQVYLYEKFDLLLSNDKELVEHPLLAHKAAYQTLFGTWIPKAEIPAKTKLCSMLASTNNFLSGHRVRFAVANAAKVGGPLHGLVDVMGGMGGRTLPHERTREAYDTYRFNLAIENSNYPWWHTEKLFNCFASKTVPIYWGCEDFSKLREWGFEPGGIVPWDGTVGSLAMMLASYGSSDSPAVLPTFVERNFQRAHELYCHEVTLEQVLRNKLYPETLGT